MTDLSVLVVLVPLPEEIVNGLNRYRIRISHGNAARAIQKAINQWDLFGSQGW